MKREGGSVQLTAEETKEYVEHGGGTANAYLNVQKKMAPTQEQRAHFRRTSQMDLSIL